MADTNTTRLTTYYIDFLGARALGADWGKLREAAGKKLSGMAVDGKEDDLWGGTYTFADPAAALQAALTTLDTVKGAFRWDAAQDRLPVQFLLHHGDPEFPLGMDPRMWAFMRPEDVYITKKAWELWKSAGLIDNLPRHTVRDDLLAALRLEISDRPPPIPVQLFPRRSAPLSGDGGGDECFYCGLRNHRPAQCPSRQLRPDVRGLPQVGRMPLQQLDRLYGKTFQGRDGPALEGEVSRADLGKDPSLQVVAAFFDLHRIYQPRFLVSMFLTNAEMWSDAVTTRALSGDSSSTVYRGYQALMAQNYPDAARLFGDVRNAAPSKKFYSQVGLAFISLEKGQPQRTEFHLSKAQKAADNEAERLYVRFLASRLQEIRGNLAGAVRTMATALEQCRSSDEARYRREQLAVLAGKTDGCAQRLQLVASRSREAAVALLIDPWFEPIREELDSKLLTLMLTAHQGGKGKFALALAQGTALADWLGERDPDVAPVVSGLHRLGDKVSQAGYYDMLELERGADKLVSSCNATRRGRRGALQNQLDSTEERWKPIGEFWREFGLKGMYRQLGEKIAHVQGKLDRAASLTKSDEVTAYKEAMDLLAEVSTNTVEIASQTREIGAMPLILTFIRRFLAYLVLMEALALAVGLTILPLFRLILSIDRGGRASAAGGNSVLYTLVFAIAPVVALVVTGLKQKKTTKVVKAPG